MANLPNLTFEWMPVKGSTSQSFSWEGAQLIHKAMRGAFGEGPWSLNMYHTATLRAIHALLDERDKVEFQPIIAAALQLDNPINLWFVGAEKWVKKSH